MTTSTTLTDVRPGRAVSLESQDFFNGERYPYPWLYVVSVLNDTAFGVMFNNSQTTSGGPRPVWRTLPLHELGDSPVSDDLTVVPWWPGMVANFLIESAATVESADAPAATSESTTGTDVEAAVAAARAEERARFEEWKSRAEEIASNYAEENNLCGEFERCLEEIGLESRRTREYEVEFTRTVTITYNGTAMIQAMSQGDAESTLSELSSEDVVDLATVKEYGYVSDDEIEIGS